MVKPFEVGGWQRPYKKLLNQRNIGHYISSAAHAFSWHQYSAWATKFCSSFLPSTLTPQWTFSTMNLTLKYYAQPWHRPRSATTDAYSVFHHQYFGAMLCLTNSISLRSWRTSCWSVHRSLPLLWDATVQHPQADETFAHLLLRLRLAELSLIDPCGDIPSDLHILFALPNLTQLEIGNREDMLKLAACLDIPSACINDHLHGCRDASQLRICCRFSVYTPIHACRQSISGFFCGLRVGHVQQ